MKLSELYRNLELDDYCQIDNSNVYLDEQLFIDFCDLMMGEFIEAVAEGMFWTTYNNSQVWIPRACLVRDICEFSEKAEERAWGKKI